MFPQVELTHYYNFKYDSKRRFASYWHQIHEVLSKEPVRVLEVGVGGGLVSDYLRKRGVDLTTVDNDVRLQPDVVADIRSLPFPDKSFDVVCAFEVLEHLPYGEACKAVEELRRISSCWVIISLPDATRIARIEFPIPWIGKVRTLIPFPRLFPLVHTVTKSGHFWEIGKRDYPMSRIVSDFLGEDFNVFRTYRVYENPYHRFLVMKLSQELH